MNYCKLINKKFPGNKKNMNYCPRKSRLSSTKSWKGNDENFSMPRTSLVIKYGTERAQVAANFHKKFFLAKQATWQFSVKNTLTLISSDLFFRNKICELYVFYQFCHFQNRKIHLFFCPEWKIKRQDRLYSIKVDQKWWGDLIVQTNCTIILLAWSPDKTKREGSWEM